MVSPDAASAILAELDDQELTDAYEGYRQEVIEIDGQPVHTRLGEIMASPLEREKDRREVARLAATPNPSELERWYANAAKRSCIEWLDRHLGARHALRSCMSCGLCAAQCPAARFHDEYSPRLIVDAALARDEVRLEALLSSDVPWLCGQCGTCRARCPRDNSVMGLVSSLRQLAELKGFHLRSVRGRQQYAARHLWGGNLWNRGVSMHFRNAAPATHPDFGPRWAAWFEDAEAQMRRVGATPDTAGSFGGRHPHPATLEELRACVCVGGTIALWQRIEDGAATDAAASNLSLDEYHAKVGSEG